MLELPWGIKLIASHSMTIGPFEDWSHVRSPSRAKRRRTKHAQNIRLYYKPSPHLMHDKINNVIYGHPVTLDRLRKELEVIPTR